LTPPDPFLKILPRVEPASRTYVAKQSRKEKSFCNPLPQQLKLLETIRKEKSYNTYYTPNRTVDVLQS